MKDFTSESVSHCAIHGYIPFTSDAGLQAGEVSERQIIDHPWVQRLRQIHQLQTAWWVYPTAEHTRFQHVVGAMHLASLAATELYPSLAEVNDDVPSAGYVESLLRMAALLHDVGHGPFGHFFDTHFLVQFGLTHEKLGAHIIVNELGPLLAGVRQNPNTRLEAEEQLDAQQIAYLITRPAAEDEAAMPRWLTMLRSLFCGIYTVDNMDFVLRDAFMSGYSSEAFDLSRLLRYSFFTDQGLTIHRRGIDALLRFMHVRAQLFRAIYYHRTVRAIDLTLLDLFADSRRYLFPGNPLEHLEAYLHFTEWSLLDRVSRWVDETTDERRALGQRWRDLIYRRQPWRTSVERNLVIAADQTDAASLFADGRLVSEYLRDRLPTQWAGIGLRVDVPKHFYRPDTQAPAARQNFLYEPGTTGIRPLTDDQLFRALPGSHRFCRVYVPKSAPPAVDGLLAELLDGLLGHAGSDDLTNM